MGIDKITSIYAPTLSPGPLAPGRSSWGLYICAHFSNNNRPLALYRCVVCTCYNLSECRKPCLYMWLHGILLKLAFYTTGTLQGMAGVDNGEQFYLAHGHKFREDELSCTGIWKCIPGWVSACKVVQNSIPIHQSNSGSQVTRVWMI